jgi:transposase
MRFKVVDYQTLRLYGPCGKRHESSISPEVCELAQYGPNIWALAVHIKQGQLLLFARASELITDLHQLDISPSTLLEWIHDVAQLSIPMVQATTQNVQTDPVVHVDKSGLGIASHLQWLHTAETATYTGYGVHSKRGMQAMQDYKMLPNNVSMFVYYCWVPYWSLICKHSLCSACLLCELVYQKVTTAQASPQGIIDTLLAAEQALPRLHATRKQYSIHLRLWTSLPNTASLCKKHRRKICLC